MRVSAPIPHYLALWKMLWVDVYGFSLSVNGNLTGTSKPYFNIPNRLKEIDGMI